MPATPSLSEQTALTIIDHWLAYRTAHTDIPGLQLCVRKKDDILFSKAYGFANIEHNQKLKPHHLCAVASQSKMFTSCALHMLQADGALSFDDKLVAYLPALAKHHDKRYRQIRLRDVLSHRAGLIRDGVQADFWNLDSPFLSEADLMQQILSADLVYDENTISKYSNAGSSLLGLVIAKVSGMPYATFIQQRILSRLGKATIHVDYDQAQSELYATGYSRPIFNNTRQPLPHKQTFAMASATGFRANAEGTSLFLYEFLYGDKLITKDRQRDLMNLFWPMANSSVQHYGLGVMKEVSPTLSLIGHSGAFPGFQSQSYTLYGSDLTVSLIINTNEPTIPMMKSIMDIFSLVENTFDPAQLRKTVVTDPLIGLWDSALFAVSPKTVLELPLDTASPTDDVAIHHKTPKGYVTHKRNGYNSPGEPLVFDYDQKGNITAANFFGCKMYPQKAFLAHYKKLSQTAASKIKPAVQKQPLHSHEDGNPE